MTDLVYYHQFYLNYQEGQSVIIDRERKFLSEIIGKCKPTDLFVNSIWFEDDVKLNKLLDNNPTRAIIYSGMDWHDNGYRRSVHEKIKSRIKDIVYIGNTDGKQYFSFWLFFVEDFQKQFYTTPLVNPNINKLYMCLNRKRHDHRVEIVGKLKENNLLEYGLVTLGGDPDTNIPPLTLPNDFLTAEGDTAAGDRKEGIPNDITSIGKQEYWNDHLINIVTETTVTSETFISEKTWKPILGLKPFMILGDYGVYKYLKEYGIDTFDDIFGTGYNDINPNNRLAWIVETLNRYKGADYNLMYNELLPRLIKNRDRMQEVFKVNRTRYNNILKSTI